MEQIVGSVLISCCTQIVAQEVFPDGKAIPEWFRENKEVSANASGKKYDATDYGVANDSMVVQTKKIQGVIDLVARSGSGVIIILKGTFLGESLFLKSNTHLHLEEDAVLKGNDGISHFPVKMTRMEGQTLKYFMALVNADGLDGFTTSGKETLNGNGPRCWKSFWLRRSINPDCTNMGEMRPRIIYLSNCKNTQTKGTRTMNSPLWSIHFYKCSLLKLSNLRITPPASPAKAPSTDAVDLDVCNNVLIKNCYMSVNDDVVALKGGKGPWADKDANNGENYDITIEDCTYGFCHSTFTCGSESTLSRSVIVRCCKVDRARALLTLKMCPDTPQKYEYILVEDITGNIRNCLNIAPWTQFYDLKDRKGTPLSYSNSTAARNIDIDCNVSFNVKKFDQYKLSDFRFENLAMRARKGKVNQSITDSFTVNNVKINQQNDRTTKTLSLPILSLLISTGYLPGADWNVQIVRHKQDKTCVISYTFDNSLAEYYILLVPQLEKKGFRGTFWVCGFNINKDNESITDTTRTTWSQSKETADNGYRISNHGWAHKSFACFLIEEIKEDISKNDSAIFVNAGVMSRTFCYPSNNKKAEGRRIAVQNRVGTRTYQRSIGSKSTLKDLEKWVNTLIETNDWGVGMTHGLTYGYDAFRNPQRLWDHLDQVKARGNEIQVGILREVASYIKEKEETKPEVVNKKNTLLIVPELKLDQGLLAEPLTMVVTGKEVKKVTVKQGKRRLLMQITDNKVLFDFDLYGGMTKVTLKTQK